mmetsp:Transcript_43168/g.101464  ORF Transcript_43168/g.101464 Transcript_43168/m.101464 type:complete len:265 (+) Transcript_43168:2042-2836(+)
MSFSASCVFSSACILAASAAAVASSYCACVTLIVLASRSFSPRRRLFSSRNLSSSALTVRSIEAAQDGRRCVNEGFLPMGASSWSWPEDSCSVLPSWKNDRTNSSSSALAESSTSSSLSLPPPSASGKAALTELLDPLLEAVIFCSVCHVLFRRLVTFRVPWPAALAALPKREDPPALRPPGSPPNEIDIRLFVEVRCWKVSRVCDSVDSSTTSSTSSSPLPSSWGMRALLLHQLCSSKQSGLVTKELQHANHLATFPTLASCT